MVRRFLDDEIEGLKVVRCKTTWKRLRDNFWRVHKMLQVPSGSGATDGRMWPLYKNLQFLLSVRSKNTRG